MYFTIVLLLFLLAAVTSGAADNKHACNTGHALRAFHGVKFQDNDEASLNQCNETRDDGDFVEVDGVTKKWRQIKLDPRYQSWDFDMVTTTAGELTSLKSKFIFVWGRVGRTYCQRYNMKFVENNTLRPSGPESNHYVLLLDRSGSMNGDPWMKLISGVNTLVNARKNGGGPRDRITIITFDDTAVLFCFNQTMGNVNTTTIPFTGGGTEFGPPIQLVIDKLREMKANNINAGLKCIIVFMSDGQASFPAAQLRDLKSLNSEIKEFWTVSLGAGAVLKEINDEMNGKFKALTNASELSTVYAQIAETKS